MMGWFITMFWTGLPLIDYLWVDIFVWTLYFLDIPLFQLSPEFFRTDLGCFLIEGLAIMKDLLDCYLYMKADDFLLSNALLTGISRRAVFFFLTGCA